jgi:hypothetical protein
MNTLHTILGSLAFAGSGTMLFVAGWLETRTTHHTEK